MFQKIKESASKNITSISDKTQEATVSIKEKSDSMTATIKQKAVETKDGLKDFSVLSKVQDFTTASVKTVEDIDAELVSSNSASI